MTAAVILEQAAAVGVQIRADGDSLVAEGPESALSPELTALLREHKAELLAYLTKTADGTGGAALTDLPLAAKLRAYGEPWPLCVDGRVAAWLVPDDGVAKLAELSEPVYTAEEVETAATLPAEDVQRLHGLKCHFRGRIGLEDKDADSLSPDEAS